MNIIKNFFRPFYDNLLSIIVSLIFAIIVWFSISLQIFPDVEKTINDIPVQIQPTEFMLTENLQLVNAENYSGLTASVSIKGKRYDIGNLGSDDFIARMDFSEVAGDGEHDIPIVVSPKEEGLCEIIRGGHSERIDIEKFISKTLEITIDANLKNNVKVIDGLQIDMDNVYVTPNTIEISGAEKIINTIEHISVNVLSDNTILQTTDFKGELTYYREGDIKIEGPEITVDNNDFTVTVPVHQIKTLPLTLNISGAPSNFDIEGLKEKISIQPKMLTISSPDHSINEVSEINISSTKLEDIDWTYMGSPKHFPVEQFLNDAYRNVSNIASCTLNFVNIDNYTRLPIALNSDNFNIINRPSGYEAEFLTEELTVNVIGPDDFILDLKPEDISITVNLLGTDITEGVQTIQAAYRIRGENVPAWVVGALEVDMSFTRRNIDGPDAG